MVRNCIGLELSAANAWVTLMGLMRGVGPLESTRHAKLCLRATLDEIEETEESLNEQLNKHVSKVKAIKAGAAGERLDMGRFKSLLLQCKKIRLKLGALSKKKQALENHMDTLDNSELNQHVLYSMQKTSTALKGMGLDKALESVDRVMMDLEDNHGDVANIQNTLAATFDSSDDFDWEAEMDMLLDDSYVRPTRTQVSAPVTSNAIELEMTPVRAEAGSGAEAEAEAVEAGAAALQAA